MMVEGGNMRGMIKAVQRWAMGVDGVSFTPGRVHFPRRDGVISVHVVEDPPKVHLHVTRWMRVGDDPRRMVFDEWDHIHWADAPEPPSLEEATPFVIARIKVLLAEARDATPKSLDEVIG